MELHNLKTRNELADFLNIPRKKLSYLLYKKGIDNSYTSFEIDKKNGGVRKINAPLTELKDIQRKLAEVLYKHKNKNQVKKNDVSHAFQKEKSIITNAKNHRNKKLVLNIDLENFFESFHFGRVRGFFIKNKNFLLSSEVATVIAQLTCFKGKLPQGAPTSPIITNLICEILDFRLLKIAKKYKLNYTRYADDLTFSTNDEIFLDLQMEFYDKLSSELTRAGFKINEKKRRLQLRDSRQVVTGLVVNKKINVNRTYYKETRAMAHQLYKEGEFKINGKPSTLNQLEGRFAFINQLTWYNNKLDNEKHNFNKLSSRELQYQKFLFYKYFFANSSPLLVTEGKTDIVYLKAALKNLYKEYPNLITRNSDGTFEFKVSFLNKTKRLSYFLGIFQDGGSALNNIYSFYDSKKSTPNYLRYFKKISNISPENPVILMFDNELESGKKKPIGSFLNNVKLNDEKKSILEEQYMVNIVENLYLLTVPLIDKKLECDIEDLFEKETLSQKLGGRVFTKKDKYDHSQYYGKEIFSKYILENYTDINFNGFRPVLNNINDITKKYSAGHIDRDNNHKILSRDSSNANKFPVTV
ncbi:MAG: retron Ec67 family RNA-directed DNA polymerase/endonuclease [Bacillota bacterium]